MHELVSFGLSAGGLQGQHQPHARGRQRQDCAEAALVQGDGLLQGRCTAGQARAEALRARRIRRAGPRRVDPGWEAASWPSRSMTASDNAAALLPPPLLSGPFFLTAHVYIYIHISALGGVTRESWTLSSTVNFNSFLQRILVFYYF